MFGQRTLNQGDGDSRIFDDQNPVFFRLVALHQIEHAIEDGRRAFFVRDGQVDPRAHQGHDGFDVGIGTEIDQLAGGTSGTDRGDAFVHALGRRTGRGDKEYGEGDVACGHLAAPEQFLCLETEKIELGTQCVPHFPHFP